MAAARAGPPVFAGILVSNQRFLRDFFDAGFPKRMFVLAGSFFFFPSDDQQKILLKRSESSFLTHRIGLPCSLFCFLKSTH